MTTIESQHLQEVLTIFSARELGQGDAAAGANLLAAMCCSLAGMQNPGSAVVTPGESHLPGTYGDSFEVDTHFIVSGARSASLIQGKVIDGLAMSQNRANEQLTAFELEVEQERAVTWRQPTVNLAESIKKSSRSKLADQMLNNCNSTISQTDDKPWLMGEDRYRNVHGLVSHPLVYITATASPSKFEAQLRGCHEGRPVLHAALNRIEDFAQRGAQCLSVIDGCWTSPTGPGTVRGTVMVNDPGSLLGEVLAEGGHPASLMSRLLWLVDGHTGPMPPEIAVAKSTVPLGAIQARYRKAMELAWDKRLQLGKVSPFRCEYEHMADYQVRWMDFLREIEHGFPGITGSARNFFPTLFLGLYMIIHAMANRPQGFKWSLDQVLALAKFLVRRMVNARASALDTGDAARLKRLAGKILSKLADCPHTVRDLTRRSHRLPGELCYQVLIGLESDGMVRQQGGRWQLVPGIETGLPHNRHTPTLEA